MSEYTQRKSEALLEDFEHNEIAITSYDIYTRTKEIIDRTNLALGRVTEYSTLDMSSDSSTIITNGGTTTTN